jgi:hypothetical protein
MKNVRWFAALAITMMPLLSVGCAAEPDAPPAYETDGNGTATTREDVQHARGVLAATRQATIEAADFTEAEGLDPAVTSRLRQHQADLEELDLEAAAIEDLVGGGLSVRTMPTKPAAAGNVSDYNRHVRADDANRKQDAAADHKHLEQQLAGKTKTLTALSNVMKRIQDQPMAMLGNMARSSGAGSSPRPR